MSLCTSQAMAMTSKNKQIVWSFGGCGTGLVTGLALGSSNDSADQSATIAANTAIGCVVGLVSGWLFVDDDQDELRKENDKLAFELKEANKIIRQENYKRVGRTDKLESMVTQSNLPKDFDFDGYKEEDCYVASFRLMNNGKKFVPVSEDIIMPNVYYYLVSKNKDSCVKADSKHGLLDDKINGLGSVLHNAADDAAKDKLKKERKK